MSAPDPFTTLSPEQAIALPPARAALAKAFQDAVDVARNLGGTGVFHIAGQPRIAIESIQSGVDPSTVTLIPVEMTGVPGGPVYTFALSSYDVRQLMMALLKAQQ